MAVIRVDDEVYHHIIKARALLEVATNRVVRFSDAVAFLLALRGDYA